MCYLICFHLLLNQLMVSTYTSFVGKTCPPQIDRLVNQNLQRVVESFIVLYHTKKKKGMMKIQKKKTLKILS